MYRQGFYGIDGRPSTSSSLQDLGSHETDIIWEQPRTSTLQPDGLIGSVPRRQREFSKRIQDYLDDSDSPWTVLRSSSTTKSRSEPLFSPGSRSELDGVEYSQVGAEKPDHAVLILRLSYTPSRQSEDTNDAYSGQSSPLTQEIVDSEAESISNHSEETERAYRDNRGFVLFEQVLCRLLKAYYQDAHKETPGQSAGDSQSRRAAARVTQEQPSRPASSARSRGKKRQMAANDNLDENEDDNDQHDPKRAKQDPPGHTTSPRFLACPFWKLDPVKHWECFKKKTRTIAYLKQHLKRKHAPEFYCHRCFHIFNTEGLYEEHLVCILCVRDPLDKLEGISHQQRKKLSAKSSGPVEEQWLTIWTLLFPDTPRPSSIYVDSDQAEMLQALHEFHERDGVKILRDVVESGGLELRLRNPDDNVDDILRAGLNCMLRYFGLGRSSTPHGNAAECSSAALMGQHEENGQQHEDTPSQVPGGSLSDPGVGADGHNNVPDTLDLSVSFDELPPAALVVDHNAEAHITANDLTRLPPQSADAPPASRTGSSATEEGDAPQTGASQHATSSGLLEVGSTTNPRPDHPLSLDDDWGSSIGFDQFSEVDPGFLAACLDELADRLVDTA